MNQRRKRNAPEVIQTSSMDCGPAALKCLLDGHHIPADYGRLREACQTAVDGTSIDTIEDVAVALGLKAQQRLLPVDHVLLRGREYLPAIAVVLMPGGFTHFVVAWRRQGSRVQIMDPGTGRSWQSAARFQESLFIHRHTLEGNDWRDWAQTDEFLDPLRQRMHLLGMSDRQTAQSLDGVLAQAGWFPLAALDAAVRMTQKLVDADGLKPGGKAAALVAQLLATTLAEQPGDMRAVPEPYWCVRAHPEDAAQVIFHGAVVVHVEGVTEPAEQVDAPPLPDDLASALQPEQQAGLSTLFRFLRDEGLLTPLILLGGLLTVAFARLVEAALFRAFLDLNDALVQPLQRLGAAALVLAFTAAILLLELPIARTLLRLGRHLETRMRMAFLEKLPRIGDRYFGSRPTSDMADRAHRIFILRDLPGLGGQLLRQIFDILLTCLAILWIDPALWPLILLMALTVLGIPLTAQPVLAEQNLRLLTHNGALSRFYLESFLGLIPIRAHGAEDAVRHEQEKLLVEWVRAGKTYLRSATWVNGLSTTIAASLTIAMVFAHLGRQSESGLVLLLIYWALRLPQAGAMAARLILMIPNQRNTARRLLDPLGAPEEETGDGAASSSEPSGGVAIAMEKLVMSAGGHPVLRGVNLSIQAGEHVVIVGRSGAGKSSLVSLLLGWHQPAAGHLHVDGQPLTPERLQQLRAQTAWVDPAVQLWNTSLMDNLHYGAPEQRRPPADLILDQADLLSILDTLPDGLRTQLGEGGALVSGGEGQRVRLGRALQRRDARLVILDEPFRGLDRHTRAELMQRARAYWQDATLLCITHDLNLTRHFPRVLVVEQGQVREDDQPETLLKQQDSRYAALYNGDRTLWQRYWQDPQWRRLRIDQGQVHEEASP